MIVCLKWVCVSPLLVAGLTAIPVTVEASPNKRSPRSLKHLDLCKPQRVRGIPDPVQVRANAVSADDYCLRSLQNRSCASHNECGVSRTCASEQRARSEVKVDILHQLFWCESKTLARVSQQAKELANELRALTSRMISRWEFAYLGMTSPFILVFEHELRLLILTDYQQGLPMRLGTKIPWRHCHEWSG